MSEQSSGLLDRLMALNSMLLDRLALGGDSTAYGGARDYNKVLGYPSSLRFEDYLARYRRQDLAARVVDLPAQDTWKKPPRSPRRGTPTRSS